MLRRLAARLPARYPMLLDSAADGPLSRTSVLLAEPSAALWLDADGRLGAEGTVVQGSTFFSALENWWLAEREAGTEAPADLPFAGGWAIQFLGHAFEGKKPAFVDDLVGLLVEIGRAHV